MGIDVNDPTLIPFRFTESGGRVWLNNEVIVRLRDGVTIGEVLSEQTNVLRSERLGGTTDQYVLTMGGGSLVALETANRMHGSSLIEWTSPNFLVEGWSATNDPFLSSQWHLDNIGQTGGTVDADIDATEAWAITTGSPDIVIAVFDSGVQLNHPDLALNIWINPGETPNNGIDDDGNGWIDDVSGIDVSAQATGFNGSVHYDNDPSPNPAFFDGHGTAVAGAAAARGDNATGVAGVAYNAKIMPIKPWSENSNGSFNFFISDLAAAIYYAAGRTFDGQGVWRGADISNHSYSLNRSFTPLDEAWSWSNQNARNGRGMPSFAATGNANSSVAYPANLETTIAVGASSFTDQRASYSNFGMGLDFVAPGGTSGSFGSNYVTTDRTGDDGYVAGDVVGVTGTSFASPTAAGIAALMLSVNADLTSQQIRTILRNTADKVGGVSYSSDGFNNQLGYGRLNAHAAVVASANSTPPSVLSFTRKSPATSPTNEDTLVFLATFSEPVLGVDASDFTVVGTTANWNVSRVTASTFDITITGGDLPNLNGIVGINMQQPSITDIAGNPLPNVEPAIDEEYLVDNTLASPTLTITSGNVVYSNSPYSAVASITNNNSPAPAITFVYYSDAAGTATISAPKIVGRYYVRAFSAANSTNLAAQSSIAAFEITPAPLVASVTANNKPFDNTTAATIASRSLGGILGTDVVTISGGSATFADIGVGNNKIVTATGLAIGGTDAGNYTFNSTATTLANITATVFNRQLFYNDSGYETVAGGSVDAALATNKVLLQSATTTQVTSFANVSNYSRGLNGAVLDIAGLTVPGLTPNDFTFRVAPTGASGVQNPSLWPAAPAPSAILVTSGTAIVPGRVQLEWTNNQIQNTWLQIIVKANANTGLTTPQTFYIGHAMAEVNGAAAYRVTGADLSAVQAGISNTVISVNDVRDVNKDRRITGADLSFVQARISNTVLLNNITIPAAGSDDEGSAGSGGGGGGGNGGGSVPGPAPVVGAPVVSPTVSLLSGSLGAVVDEASKVGLAQDLVLRVGYTAGTANLPLVAFQLMAATKTVFQTIGSIDSDIRETEDELSIENIDDYFRSLDSVLARGLG